jgi:metallo-beta-lactamase family protein
MKIQFISYQASGGVYIPANAEIHNLEALSSHGDYQQIIDWLKPLPQPKKIFITHGGPTAVECMCSHIRKQIDWQEVIVPEYLDIFEL